MAKKTKHTFIQNIQYFFACLFFASLNFEVFSPFMPNFSIAKMAGLLYIGTSLLTPNKIFLTDNIRRPLYSACALYFLMVLSSIIHIEDNSSIFNTTMFLNIIMYWLLLNHRRRDERVFYEGLLWFSVSSCVVGICFFCGIGISIDEDMRIVVFDENANGLGIKMCVGALFLITYCLNHSLEKPIRKPWLLIMTVPMLALLFATASRTAFLVLASGIILFIFFRKTKKRINRLLWIIFGVIILFYGYQFVLQQEVLVKRMERTIDNGSLSDRDYIWAKYIELIKQHPILGVGFHGADRYAIQVFGEPKSPHNVLVETTVYSGLIGLSFFLVFLLFFFQDAWLYWKKLNYCGPLIISIALLGVVMSGQAFGMKLFWVVVAYANTYRLTPSYNDSTIMGV